MISIQIILLILLILVIYVFLRYSIEGFTPGDPRLNVSPSIFSAVVPPSGAEENSELSVEDKFVNRKAKWAYDISNAIDNLQKQDTIRNIGTLPKIKITKNG